MERSLIGRETEVFAWGLTVSVCSQRRKLPGLEAHRLKLANTTHFLEGDPHEEIDIPLQDLPVIHLHCKSHRYSP